ncbi:MAG: hypothetical protein MHM6MM_002034 [Cercozoa sp. M6MM]
MRPESIDKGRVLLPSSVRSRVPAVRVTRQMGQTARYERIVEIEDRDVELTQQPSEVEVRVLRPQHDEMSAKFPASASVAEVREHFFAAELSQRRRVRLIRQGRVLPDSDVLRDMCISSTSNDENVNITNKMSVTLHASVGAPGSLQQQQQQEPTQPQPADDDETDQDEQVARRLAAQLDMEAQTVLTASPEHEPSSAALVACGFAIGFALGIFGLIWVWAPSVPRKQKIGILLGVIARGVMGMLMTDNKSTSSPSSPSDPPSIPSDTPISGDDRRRAASNESNEIQAVTFARIGSMLHDLLAVW